MQRKVRRAMINDASPYPWIKKSLNDFLESEECRREYELADDLLYILQRYDTKIWTGEQLNQFIEDHPSEFRPSTPDEIARNATIGSTWDKYQTWRRDHGRPPVELRPLGGVNGRRFFRERAGEGPW
jgi:hypothetical protein